MTNKIKISIFFIILLLIISLGTAGFYFISYENEKKVRSQLEQELNLARDENNKILIRLEEIKKEKITLETKLKENEVAISDLNEKLTKEKEAKESLIKEQENLQNKISAIEQEKQSLQSSLNEKLQQLTQLQNRLDTVLKKEKSEEKTTQEQGALKDKAEDLDKIVVSPSGSAQNKPEEISENIKNEVSNEIKSPKTPLSSKVILINREYEFLVLNIGKTERAELGDIFEVLHENESLGNVQIEQVRDTMSAANFLEGFKKEQVSEGDIANRIN